MGVKFSEDVVPLSDIKVNPGKIVGVPAKPTARSSSPAAGAGWRLFSRSAIGIVNSWSPRSVNTSSKKSSLWWEN